jgi:hypothetical protein
MILRLTVRKKSEPKIEHQIQLVKKIHHRGAPVSLKHGDILRPYHHYRKNGMPHFRFKVNNTSVDGRAVIMSGALDDDDMTPLTIASVTKIG